MTKTLNNSPSPSNASITESRFLAARDNPLCVNRVSNIGYKFAQHDWCWQLARLHTLEYRAAIVGQQGSGKTTLLSELARRLDRSDIINEHIFLPQESTEHGPLLRRAITGSQAGAVILVDGIERLNFFRRRQLLKRTQRGAGLIVTVHHACELPTWIHCQTDQELMTSVLLELDLHDTAILSAGQQAFGNSNGNIRDALRELYDQFASGRFNDIVSR